MLNEEKLAELKEKLLSEKKKMEDQLATFADKSDDVKGDYVARFQDYGDEEEQNANEVADYDTNRDLEQKLEVELKRIDKALVKMEEGTYGICEVTGKDIPLERLEVLPWAETVVDAQK